MLAVCLAASLAAPPLEVRLGRVGLTPPEHLPLGGYTARKGKTADAGGEALYARFLALRQGKTSVVIASVEMLTVPGSLAEAVQKAVGPGTLVFLAATHTHSAPDSQMLNDRMTLQVPGIASYSRRWSAWYAARIADGIKATLVSPPLPPLRLGLIRASVALNRNRRSGPQPSPLATRLEYGQTPLLTAYAAHPTFYDEARNTPSGDWPGEEGRRTGAPVLVGAIGDVSPVGHGPTTYDRIDDFCTRLQSTLRRPPTIVLEPSLAVESVPVRLPKPTPHPTFAKTYKVPESLAQVAVTQFAPTHASLTIVRIGKLILVGVPGEPTDALGRRISAVFDLRGMTSLVCSHVNGWVGYILEPVDYDRGGYEATLAFHGREFADRIVDAAKAGAQGLGLEAR